MLFNLADVVGSLEETSVVVRGKRVRVRAVTAAQSTVLWAQLAPQPPSPDPSYQADADRRNMVISAQRRAVLAAIATDFPGPDGLKWSRELTRTQVEKIADHVLGIFTEGEIFRITSALERLNESGGDTPEAVGNPGGSPGGGGPN